MVFSFIPRSPISNSILTTDLKPTPSDSTNLEVSPFEQHRNPFRRSVSENFHTLPTLNNNTTFPNASTSQLDLPTSPPPVYDYNVADLPLPKSRFKISPRAEEGNEVLPAYSSSLLREGVFERKMEKTNPFERANDRSWSRVYVVLNNTVLNVYKTRKLPTVALLGDEGIEQQINYGAGSLIKSYTLQHAEVGAATDYRKKKYVIRIRVETQQFLLSCSSVDILLEWLEALSSGVDLSLPLDERSLPCYQTIPRRRRRRRAAEMVQQQEEIIRRHFPQLLNTSLEESITLNFGPLTSRSSRNSSRNVAPVTSGSTSSLTGSSNDAMVESANVPDIEVSSPPEEHDNLEIIDDSQNLPVTEELLASHRPPISRAISAPASISSTSVVREQLNNLAHFATGMNTPINTQNKDEKWRGCSAVSYESNLRFARRCMATLVADAPRQTDFVVFQGVRYKLLATGKGMIPECKLLALPAYSD